MTTNQPFQPLSVTGAWPDNMGHALVSSSLHGPKGLRRSCIERHCHLLFVCLHCNLMQLQCTCKLVGLAIRRIFVPCLSGLKRIYLLKKSIISFSLSLELSLSLSNSTSNDVDIDMAENQKRRPLKNTKTFKQNGANKS